MPKVYRLEHRNKKLSNRFNVYASPYGISNVVSKPLFKNKYMVLDKGLKAHSHSSIGDELYRPAPQEDGLGDYLNDNMICGSPTLNDLAEWFNPIFDKALELGFVVRVYTVNIAYIGDSLMQSIFDQRTIIGKKIIKI